jgi:hypothetical protein
LGFGIQEPDILDSQTYITRRGHTMTTAKRFEELVVWQKAHQLVLAIYKLTKDFPKEEIFGLTSQFRKLT